MQDLTPLLSYLCVFLEVVPVPVVQPLPQQLDGRLSTILLPGRHVQIIHKHNLPRKKKNRQVTRLST